MKELKGYLVLVSMFILVTPVIVHADLEYVGCGATEGIPKPLTQMTSMLYTILMIGVPLILILFGVLTMIKALKESDADEVLKAKNKLIKKFVMAATILLLMGITQFVMLRVTSDSGDRTSVISCLKCFMFQSDCHPSTSGNGVNSNTYRRENPSSMSQDTTKYREEMERRLKRVNGDTSNGNISADGQKYKDRLNSMSTPSMSELESAASKAGLTTEQFKIVLGTTANEGYSADPFLYYGWASAMINTKPTILGMQPWDPDHYTQGQIRDDNFYSMPHIEEGISAASDDVKKSVYLALTERNTKIIECNGMYSTTPSNYNLLYASTVYNCNVYETK